jgi:phosphatidate cytidylyltransferase
VPPLLLRVLSSLVMAPVALGLVYLGGVWFQALVAIVILIGIIEWFSMCAHEADKSKKLVWLITGVTYLIICGLCLIWLRQSDDTGLIVVCWLFALVWGTDSGAYLAGSTIGGPKLAPRISPKKTWAGLIGGIVTAAGIGYLAYRYFGASDSAVRIVMISIALAVVSQIGDLIESHAKRHFGVKDSGSIIPGHGGVLDRIDGLAAAAIGAGVARWAFQDHSGLWL